MLYNVTMSLDVKYWLALASTIVTGFFVIQGYALVFNGIDSPSAVVVVLFVLSVLLFIASAVAYYYLKSARKHMNSADDMSILLAASPDRFTERPNIDKK